MITQSAFDGLAFPTIRVRYNGESARYSATLRRDTDRTYRASIPYDYAMDGGARQALIAAQACWRTACADLKWEPEPHVFIPGDLDASSYVFVVVPTYNLSPDAS